MATEAPTRYCSGFEMLAGGTSSPEWDIVEALPGTLDDRAQLAELTNSGWAA
jgi:hypothetical protein